ncbi:cobalamin biosynthesis protein [Ferrimonas lipolytica]|uniref:Adenosylcobinamide-phosphate synthase n=1 Tax=Ferrimonas lipolytica TaxID=2724191 RepID=A0A6H1ULR9_9GAMM|nr:cobalamin biosynthesis protein [Ferrimonas lipolytica]QIZ78742.1 hypothetical protein HER31_18645 [Ferrimonas lipolytica]
MAAMLGIYGPLLWPPIILIAASLLAWLVPQRLHLQRLVEQWAKQLQHKTHHPRRSPQQRCVAGLLAMLLISAPLAAIMVLAMSHPLLELLLLALLLPSRNFTAAKLLQPLQQGDKEQARAQLSQWTIRDTEQLSIIGITKAGIEAQLAQRASQFFGVVFWYLLAGLPLALLLWLSSLLARQWHIDKPLLQPFGSAAFYLASLMMIPVNGLLGVSLSCYGSVLQPWRLRYQLRGSWERRHQQWLQLCLACSLGIQLSGPWMLQGKRLERPKLGPTVQAQPAHLIRAQRMLNYAQTLWLLLPLLSSVAIAWLWHQGQ